MKLSGIARIPLAALRFAEGLGAGRADLLRQADLREEDLADPDERVPENKIVELWRVVIRRFPEVRVGLRVGSESNLRDWGLVGYTMASCRTLRHALARLERYSAILNEAFHFSMVVDDRRGEFFVSGVPAIDSLCHPVDARMAMVLNGARELVAAELVPIEAHFGYDRPADTSEHARIFRCPLKFGHPVNGLVLGQADLDRPVNAADDTLRGYLERLADQAIASLEGQAGFLESVQRTIWAELSGGKPTVPTVAGLLAVSPRTLQRRLRAEGTSFAAELDSLRRNMAIGLLRDRNLAVYEVAFLLGYSDPSTFYRAFRKWHGIAPAAFRRSLR